MKRILLFAAVLMLCASSMRVSAQTQTPVINKRQVHQQERIKEGVKSGQLTHREARRLEAKQRKIQADKMIAKADGKVTPAERRHIKREQNRASRHIYRAKHNSLKRKA